jgi:hypothetical protein
VDLNLDTLKREILEYLERSDFAIFHSNIGALDAMPFIMWDSFSYPDYQMFLETARKAGARIILFASREFDKAEIDDAVDQLEDCEFGPAERREMERRLRDLRVFTGLTCGLELGFQHESQMYVYEVRPDWYEEFIEIGEEISSNLPMDEDDADDALGGYFSKN